MGAPFLGNSPRSTGTTAALGGPNLRYPVFLWIRRSKKASKAQKRGVAGLRPVSACPACCVHLALCNFLPKQSLLHSVNHLHRLINQAGQMTPASALCAALRTNGAPCCGVAGRQRAPRGRKTPYIVPSIGLLARIVLPTAQTTRVMNEGGTDGASDALSLSMRSWILAQACGHMPLDRPEVPPPCPAAAPAAARPAAQVGSFLERHLMLRSD